MKTWVCLEAVTDPEQALALIQELRRVVGHWKAGMLNERKGPRAVNGIKSRRAESVVTESQIRETETLSRRGEDRTRVA